MRISKKLIAVALAVLMAVSMMPFTASAATAYYEKVTSNLTDWTGDYLIVYENGNKAFNGGSSSINSAGNLIDVTISNGKIESNNTTNAAKVTIEKNGSDYYLKAKNDYIGGTSSSNTIVTSDSGLVNTFTYDNGDVHIVSGTSYFRFNTGWNGFRYYRSNSYTSQQAVQLYKLQEAAPSTPVKPTATVTEIPYAVVQQYFQDAPAMDVVYAFVANNDGDDMYRTYNADFVISFDKAVPQGAVKLYGQYGQYPITECPITKDLAAGEEYRLLKDSMGIDMTYQQILDEVQTFFCGAKYAAAAAGATMTIKLAIYETAVNPETGMPEETGTEVEIEDAEQTDTAPTLPQATVTDITNTEENTLGLDKAIKFQAPEGETAYDDEYCDFVISFDHDVTSNDIELWGNYGNYGWVNLNQEASGNVVTFEAGKNYYLLRDIVKWPMTYGQIRDNVGTFLCGLNVKMGAAGVTTNVELALFEEPAEGEEPAPVQVGEDIDYTAPALPQATVTDITNTEENTLGLDAAYKFEAPAEASAYDNEYCDFIVRFDHDVTSDDVQLWGKYGNYDWTSLASEASGDAYTFEAGKDYYLLRDVIKWPMTYAQIRAIGTFLCGVNTNYGANGTTMDVELALYEEPAQGEEPVAVVLDDEEFVAPEKPAPAADEISITTADEVDVNLYLSETGEEATVEYTFNASPDEETDDQETVTVAFNSLPEVDGKRKLTITVAPAQIKDNITIIVKNAAGQVVRSYENYSVAAYCNELIAGNYSEAIKNLAKSVLDYGKAASAFFGYNTGAYDNQAYNNTAAFDFSTVYNYFAAFTSGVNVSEVRYVAKSVPDLRFVVDVPEDVAVTLNPTTDKGYAAKYAKDATTGKVLLCVEGIPAAKLHEAIEIDLGNGASITYTPLVYAYQASKSDTPALRQLGNSIAYYWQAANAVFA